MPVSNGRRAAGLVVLSVDNALAVWSATNTSYVGHRAFGLAGLIALYGRDALPAAVGATAMGTLLCAIYDRPLRSAAAPLGLL